MDKIANKTISKTIHQLKNAPLANQSAQPLKSSERQDQKTLYKLASKVLADPIACRRLSERVLEIMRLDLQQQRERGGQY